jgi:hypothetical protein
VRLAPTTQGTWGAVALVDCCAAAAVLRHPTGHGAGPSPFIPPALAHWHIAMRQLHSVIVGLLAEAFSPGPAFGLSFLQITHVCVHVGIQTVRSTQQATTRRVRPLAATQLRGGCMPCVYAHRLRWGDGMLPGMLLGRAQAPLSAAAA